LVLLTLDGTFHDDNEAQLPELHHGLVIVSNAGPKGLTSKDAMATLEKFKAGYPQWHQMGPANVILQITQAWVEASTIVSAKVRMIERIEFNQAGWQQRLDAILTAQRSRGAIAATPPRSATQS
jgi:hypothetical protein